MGNITADGTGAVDTTIVIGQSKISLSDPLKSIVGRSVVVHQDNDDGRGQWGTLDAAVLCATRVSTHFLSVSPLVLTVRWGRECGATWSAWSDCYCCS